MVAKHYERDFDMIFPFKKSEKKLVAEHYEGNFDMNFLFMAPRILIAEHYERDFEFLT